ncbi:hypothetical protein LWI29_030322 [Acer saccharum]|uniref:Uncharacterized protein n=1 Tax=Acer saccharum TaxID=4024 RepID=A0AA39SVL6_ACESA|nr:hypothetical protein LWI29_030322 [Acer saccharum]
MICPLLPQNKTFLNLTSSDPFCLNLRHLYSGDQGAMVQEEFVETEYYKELVSIDKQHHTTGSGFIRVVIKEGSDSKENGYDIDQFGSGHGGGDHQRPNFKSNPATNDWLPSAV